MKSITVWGAEMVAQVTSETKEVEAEVESAKSFHYSRIKNDFYST